MSAKTKGIYAIFVAVLALFCFLLSSSSGGGSSSSGKKWGDLNEQEKANARWAYYAQQAIDEKD